MRKGDRRCFICNYWKSIGFASSERGLCKITGRVKTQSEVCSRWQRIRAKKNYKKWRTPDEMSLM